MTRRLVGRTALVTGSTSNIGKSIAIALAADGARVIVSGRDLRRGAAAVDGIRRKGGEASFIAAELDGSARASRDLATKATAVYGPIDVLVNNAGVYPPGGTLALDDATFDHIFGVNVKAPFFLTAALVPAMVAAGSGVVINLGSWVARLGMPSGAAYASSKGAVETLTRAWAAEFGAYGVRVNAISPGVTFEDGSDVIAIAGPLMESTPLGRVVDPAAVGAAAAFLASDDAAYMNGTVVDVDGGRVSVLTAAR